MANQQLVLKLSFTFQGKLYSLIIVEYAYHFFSNLKIILSSSDDDNIVNDDEYIVFTAVISHESDVQDVTWETADTDLGKLGIM